MSFDLHVLRVDPGPDEVERAARSFRTLDAEVFKPTTLDPAVERRREQIVDTILRALPWLTSFERDLESLALADGTTVEEARRKWRHVELNGPGDLGSTAQFLVFDHHVTIHWYSGTSTRQMEEVLAALCRVTGWAVYDPQARRVSRP